jgi:predicted O-methyltransferase YrrM
MIDKVVINSTDTFSELCMLGRHFGTDKSPYNVVAHRHPYTGVYSILFSTLKNKPIRFAEIGVAGGASARLWDEYFTNSETKIEMFDRDSDFLKHADDITSGRVSCNLMDVQKEGDIKRGLQERGDSYDVIIDDSTHGFEDQIRIVKEAFPLLKPGGILVVEDVFRATEEKKYEQELEAILSECSTSYFVICDHMARWSPGWDNDKLLVLVRA